MKRIQFDFDEGAYARLERLQADTDAASKAEVVRRALRWYEYAVGNAGQGIALPELPPDVLKAALGIEVSR